MQDPWIIVAALAAVASAGLAWYAITRRHPPLDAEFATKGEMRIAEAKMETRVNTLESHIHAQIQRLDDKMDQRFEQADTKMTEALSDLDAKRSRQVSTLHDAIRAVDIKVERLLGRLEGK